MFKDVGKNIMRLAKIEGWALFAVCIILAICFLTDKDSYYSWMPNRENDIYALYCIILGICGLVSALPLYGLGQLVDDIHVLRNKTVPEKQEVKNDVTLPEV